ncbi:Isochorismatase hydrolase [Pleomassaria siparia CBS 279.74]|uniref:Isochorismatase hydrolase n=1 Tax=Pleomassaria siparia CBS 279.74 TaxID=1314801 RepID=A0A6G1KL69_9PLEO|nr:Isochorismatase hydrolase [Pleomassaria siparia CBS 279.74]
MQISPSIPPFIRLNPPPLHSIPSARLDRFSAITYIFQLLPVVRREKMPIYYYLHQQYKPTFRSGLYTHDREQPSAGGVEYGLTKSSSFDNTDLGFQLRQREIRNVVVSGLTMNGCVEATARYAYIMSGYYVTLLADATADFTVEQKKAAIVII